MADLCLCHQADNTPDWAARHEILGTLRMLDVTQRSLAAAVGITEQHLSSVLQGRQGLTFDLAERLLTALGRRMVISTVTADPMG